MLIHKVVVLRMNKCEEKESDDLTHGLAVEMPCPPVIDDGEIQGSYPCLRAELRHLEIMVSAEPTQTQGVGYKV